MGALGGALAGESGLFGQYRDGNFGKMVARALVSGAAGCAGAVITGGKCAQAAVTAAFASLYNGDGGLSKYGWAAAEIGAGFIPGVGEAQDLSILFGKDSSGFERFVAGASLVVNVLTGGLAPNAGSYIRAGRHLCSFDGDTRVKTRLGLLPIKELKAREHEVWARDADTGEMGWKPITATHVNGYDETVTLTIRDNETGATQRIVSNRVHPFYVGDERSQLRLVVNAAPLLAGRNASGRWVEAQYLAAGDLLLDADGSFSEVVARTIERAPLTAYNLTVADWHTYFVAGADAANDNAPAVWVHNCDVYKITDAMSDRQFTKLVKDIAENGLKDNVIKYVEHNGERHIVLGNNRCLAANQLGIRNQLIFERVDLPFRGCAGPGDLILDGRMPRYRGR